MNKPGNCAFSTIHNTRTRNSVVSKNKKIDKTLARGNRL